MQNIPYLQKKDGVTQLIVDEKPMILLAGELHNSSGSNVAYFENALERVVASNCNAVIAPVSWELLEPVEGNYDFSLVDGMLNAARRRGLRLVLIWFGTWKNAMSTYAPAWVKKDVVRFPRAENSPGKACHTISPLAYEACRCDARAFAALMRHLKSVDENERTVVMMQVENEAGLMGSPRDYSPLAEKAFASLVPESLMNYLQNNVANLMPELKANWAKSGNIMSGTWHEIFGTDAPEVFMAWHVATFINEIAKAGIAEYSLPMFANAWLVQDQGQQPGSYPCGGPVAKMMDIWRAAAPQIDALAPDIYLPDFQSVCAEYSQNGNPLIIPEAQKPCGYANVFSAVAKYNAICFAPFGIDSIEHPEVLAESYSALTDMMPLVTQYQGTGCMVGFAQENVTRVQSPNGAWVQEITKPVHVDVGGYHLTINFQSGQSGLDSIGRGLIIAVSDIEYYIAAAGCTISWHPKADDRRTAEFISVDEGCFVNGKWQHYRRLNGDEAYGEFQCFNNKLSMRKVVLHSF
jgi:hypothetical protein